MIRLSASSIDRYFSCPCKYRFAQQYKPKKALPQHFIDGLATHSKLSGQDAVLTERAQVYYNTLKEVEELHQFNITHRELDQIFSFDQVELHRIIDGVGYRSQTPIIIDYKTSSKLWGHIPAGYSNTVSSVSPKSEGFQAVVYLIPPPEDMMVVKPWAKRLYFLVATSSGEWEVIEYRRKKKDYDNLKHAIKQIVWAEKSGCFPQYKGFACGSSMFPCDFQAICYEQKDWWEQYDEKSIDTGSKI